MAGRTTLEGLPRASGVSTEVVNYRDGESEGGSDMAAEQR